MTIDAFAVKVRGPEVEVRRFLFKYPAEPQFVKRDGHTVSFQVLLRRNVLEILLAEFPDIATEVLFNASDKGRLQLQTDTANRFSANKIPKGLGRKVPP
jgi:hypothetical protein